MKVEKKTEVLIILTEEEALSFKKRIGTMQINQDYWINDLYTRLKEILSDAENRRKDKE